MISHAISHKQYNAYFNTLYKDGSQTIINIMISFLICL